MRQKIVEDSTAAAFFIARHRGLEFPLSFPPLSHDSMKNILPLAVLVVVLPAVAAQVVPTPVAVFSGSPGTTQANTFPSCLIVLNAGAQAPGMTFAPFPGSLGLFSPSKTFSYTCVGNQVGVAPGILSYPQTVLEGIPYQPLALGLSVLPAGLSCGGSTGTSCLAGGSPFNNQLTPYGRYHLTPTPEILFDGISASHPHPAALDMNGQFSLNGTMAIDTVSNGGSERRLAIQAIVVDPSAPGGLTLSACLNLDQWIAY